MRFSCIFIGRKSARLQTGERIGNCVNQNDVIKQLEYSLQALSLDAEQQIVSFEDFAVVTDELVLDFDNAFGVAFGNYPSFFNEEQLESLNKIDAHIDSMPPEDMNMSIDDELRTHPYWKQMRTLAKEALVKFHWSSKMPPFNRAV